MKIFIGGMSKQHKENKMPISENAENVELCEEPDVMRMCVERTTERTKQAIKLCRDAGLDERSPLLPAILNSLAIDYLTETINSIINNRLSEITSEIKVGVVDIINNT